MNLRAIFNLNWLFKPATEPAKNREFDGLRAEAERLARLARMNGVEHIETMRRRLEIITGRREIVKHQIDRLKRAKKRWTQYEPEFTRLTAERESLMKTLGDIT